MAEAKLQELIDTLKRQGIESGEEIGRRTIDEARRKADEIVAGAESEARKIVAKAKADAEKKLLQLNSSLKIASSQFVTNLKRVIEDGLLTIPLKEKLAQDMSDEDFLKKLMTTFVETYASNPQHKDIRLLLPKEADEDLWDFALQLAAKHYGSGVDKENLNLDLETDGVKFGFMVHRVDGTVRMNFSDEAFLELFMRFLSPRLRNLFRSVKITE